MSTKHPNAEGWQMIEEQNMRNFMERCLLKIGARKEDAVTVANCLILADKRGIYTHGVMKLDMYVNDVKFNTTSVEKNPVILKETVSTAWVDGNHCLGAVVGTFCMDLAIKKAKETGVGWVVAKGSTHFGIAGYYSTRAAQHNCLGLCFTNSSPFLVPTRSCERALGTNPMACAAPGVNGQDFDLDMATTTVAHSKIVGARNRGELMPDGWAVDGTGKNTNDPRKCKTEGGGFPLGGKEQNGGYKGYGLAMMVEILCSIMGGANFGKNVRPYRTNDKLHNLGHCFIAVDPVCFAPGFDIRLSELIEQMHGLEKAEGEEEILVAGELEKRHVHYCNQRGGIPYPPQNIKETIRLAKELGVEPPTVEK